MTDLLGELAPVLNGLADGVQIVDPAYRYLYLNDAAVRHARLPREALIGRTMLECYPGIASTPLFATVQRCMQERSAQTVDNTFTYEDGTSQLFEVRLSPISLGLSIVSVEKIPSKRFCRCVAAERRASCWSMDTPSRTKGDSFMGSPLLLRLRRVGRRGMRLW